MGLSCLLLSLVTSFVQQQEALPSPAGGTARGPTTTEPREPGPAPDGTADEEVSTFC